MDFENTNTAPVYDLTYRISESDYEEFNFDVVKDDIEKRRKRSKTLGTFEVIVGAVMLVSMLTAKAESDILYYLLDLLLILMGTYSLSFYKYIFPKKLKKASGENYRKNPYLLNDIHVEIFENGVHEQSFELDNFVGWDGVSRVKFTKSLAILVLRTNKCVIIPQREIEDISEFKKFISGIHDAYGVGYVLK